VKSRQAWIVAAATVLAGIALALVQNKVAPAMGTLQEAFNIDMATAGWLSSLFSLVGIVIAIPAAIILNKVGPKKGGIVALACAIGGSLIGVLTIDTTILMISRIVEGMGVGLISVIGPSIIAMWFPETKRGLPMSIWGAYQMGAQAIMFFLGGVLTTNFGWQGIWWFGLIACVVALAFYLVCVKSPRPEESFADVESTNVSIVDGMKSASSWLAALATMLFSLGCFGFVNWVATYWSETFNWSIDEANIWVGYFSIAAVFAAVIIGAILNKLKNRKLFGMAALVAYGLAGFWGMSMVGPELLILFVIIYGFVDAGFPCVLWTVTPQTVKKPELAGVALGVVSLGFNLGVLLGPPVIGAVVQSFGWNAGAWVILIVCVLGMAVFALCKTYYAEGNTQDT
jgi:MFS family permease